MRLRRVLFLLGILCFGFVFVGVNQFCPGFLVKFFENGPCLFVDPQGGVLDRVFVCVCMVLIGVLGLVLIYYETRDWDVVMVLCFFVGLAMAVRSFCMNYMSGDYGLFLHEWVDYFRKSGGFAGIAGSVGDYNAPYLYFLALISYSGIPDLYLIKLFSMLFDIILAWGCFRLVRIVGGNLRMSYLAFALTLFLPVVILNGSFWAQCDAVYAALCVHSLALFLEDKKKLSVALLAVSFSFKLQTVFFIPVFGVLWAARKIQFRDLLVFLVVYGLSIAPALVLGKSLGDILGVYVSQAGEYEDLTMGGASVFGFLPTDYCHNGPVWTGYLGYLGIGLSFALCVLFMILGFRFRNRIDNRMILLTASLLVIGVPFFLPHMHDRYFILANVFTLCLACVELKKFLIALLCNISSVLCYMLFLRCESNFCVVLRGHYYAMLLETSLMLFALTLCVDAFVSELRKSRGNNFGQVQEVHAVPVLEDGNNPRVRDGDGADRDPV